MHYFSSCALRPHGHNGACIYEDLRLVSGAAVVKVPAAMTDTLMPEIVTVPLLSITMLDAPHRKLICAPAVTDTLAVADML
jgi:hypothetical protein